jgi:hypothetical protein
VLTVGTLGDLAEKYLRILAGPQIRRAGGMTVEFGRTLIRLTRMSFELIK